MGTLLSPAGHKALDTCAEALLGLHSGDENASATTALLAHLPGRERIPLVWFLRLVSIARLSPRAIRHLALHGPAPIRTALAGLRSLLALAAYGDADRAAGVGYDGPWLGRVPVPVLPGPDLSAAQNGADIGAVLRADVCVIGLGAGGSTALRELALAGVDAVGVETGPVATAGHFTQRELDMMPLLYHEAGLRTTADRRIGILYGRGVGGSTLHNTGLVVAPPASVLRAWRDEHGFEPADIEEHVRAALDTLRAVKIPHERINANNEVIRRGADALGWSTFVAMHNRAECCGCGYCMLGCAYNRKYNASLTAIPSALEHGARVLHSSGVQTIERLGTSFRVSITTSAGTRTIECARVIVAAGAVNTPALLQRSRLGSRRVGRNLRLHPAAAVIAEMPDRIEAWRGLPQSVILDQHASFLEDGHGGFLALANAATAPGLFAATAGGIGAGHVDLMKSYAHAATTAVLLHDEHAGRVRGSAVHYAVSKRDGAVLLAGVRAVAELQLAAGAKRVWLPLNGAPPVHSAAEVAGVLRAARGSAANLIINSVHPQGSCNAGDDERRHAATPAGELRGAPGVYIADASLFPSSVGVPPQVTVMALARHVARELVQAL